MRNLKRIFSSFFFLLVLSCITNLGLLMKVLLLNIGEEMTESVETEIMSVLKPPNDELGAVFEDIFMHKSRNLNNSTGVRYVQDIKNMSYSSLPWAPAIFYVDEERLKKKPNPSSVNCDRYPNPLKDFCCEIVYFIGSYKCGSTTLAVQLKHKIDDKSKHDPFSGFIEAGKEPCWGLTGVKGLIKQPGLKSCQNCNQTNESSSLGSKRPLLLDACPHYTGAHALKLYCFSPQAKIVMLIRDPYDRLVSHYNNNVRRRKLNSSLSDFLKNGANFEYSKYHSILSRFLLYFNTSQILLVQTEALTSDAPNVVNTVRKHFGLQPRNISDYWGNKGEGSAGYINPHENIDLKLMKDITKFNVDFFEYVGYKFNWKMYYGS